MGASSGALYRVGSVTLINGSKVVTGSGTSWISALIAIAKGDLFTLDMNSWYEVVSIDSDTSITLERNFQGGNVSGANYAILRNTSGTILTRIAGQIAVQFNQKQLFLDELRTWLNSTNANENITDSHGLSHSITTPKKMESDAQALIDNNQAIIDNSVSDTIGKIRYSKLDNPLCHLFKKNKLVDTLSGALSWTRASGATYIDRYGKLQYSPSPNATNLALWSEDFSNAAWTLNGSATVTANVHKSLGLSVNELNGTEADYDIRQSVTLPATPTTVTVSLFFEKGSAEITLLGAKSGASGFDAMTFNMLTGQVTNLTADAGDVEDLGDSYRAWFKYTTDGTAIFSQVRIRTDLATVYVTGMQVEKSKVASGYVKTEATSKTGTNHLGIEQARQEKKGWLIEGASTNSVLHNDDISNAAWTKGVIFSGSAIEDVVIDGYNMKGITVTTTGVHLDSLTESGLTTVVGEYITYSAIISKTGGALGVSIIFKGGHTTGWQSGEVYFDGSIDSSTGSAWELLETKELTANLIRIAVRMKADVAALSRVAICPIGASGVVVGHQLFISKAQVERLPFASSIIMTTDSPVTRAADIVTARGNENIPLLDSASTISVITSTLGGNTSKQSIFAAYANSNINRSMIFWNESETKVLNYISGTNKGLGVASQNDVNHLVSTYESNGDLNGYVNGALSNSSNVPYTDGEAAATTIYIGKENGTAFLYGHISDFRIYDFALNADEVLFLAGE